MKPHKPFPPFGKQLWININNGKPPKNDVFLFLGIKAWSTGKTFSGHQTVLILPLGHDPDKFYWPVNKCSILAFDTGSYSEEIQIRKLAYILLTSGAEIVRFCLDQGLVIYRKGEIA